MDSNRDPLDDREDIGQPDDEAIEGVARDEDEIDEEDELDEADDMEDESDMEER